MSADDRLAIQELNYKYAYFIDSLDPENWADIFAPDGVLDESEFFPDARFAGREAILAYGTKISGNVHNIVHLMTNQIINDLTPTSARGTAFALVETMRKTGERLRFHVKYEDEFVKIDGSWRIAQKTLRKSLPPEDVKSSD
ncbi:nuclear transport factor 2 family protein [Sphingobium sp. AN558]|uniref:nuclear transport factor 2 family protein n=1 Tax=Sphingobium sp. AN558 TaxID=3133442 RepID=UPI0030BDBFD8